MKEIFLDNKIAFNYYENNKNEILIIAPGWFMTKDSKIFCDIAETFESFFDVAVIDFRGHGKSKGFFSFSAKEHEDLRALIEYLRSKYKNIYLMGFSLGAATSLIYSSIEQSVNKLILVSVPSCFSKIENQFWQKNAWVPTFKKFELKRWLSIRPSFIPYKKIKPIDVINKVDIPILFVTGEKDPIVFPWHTVKLYEKYTGTKLLKIFENGKHAEDIFVENKAEFTKTCLNWLLNR